MPHDSVNHSRLYSLLKRTEPVPGECDVVWHGPYHVPRPRQWYPSHLLLYSVDTEGLYVAEAKMALALGKAKIPFEFVRSKEVPAALRRIDTVEVGPGFGEIALDNLLAVQRDSTTESPPGADAGIPAPALHEPRQL